MFKKIKLPICRSVIIPVLILNNLFVFGQKLYTIKVVDSKNGAELSDVHIINTGNNKIYISDEDGNASLKSPGIYRFSRLGFEDKLIEVSDIDYKIVQLNIKASELNEIVVRSNQMPNILKKSVSTINIISSKDIENESSFDISPVLNKVPGVFMHSGSLNTNRIVIRGVGSRNLYGTSKIRAYFEDIPLTTGNGETTIEDFELASIARLEIIKGSSSIFGAGLGGTVQLTPQNSYLNETSAKSEVLFGSFGLKKAMLNFNHGNATNSVRGIYSNTHSDGYRENNQYDRQTITLTSNHYLNENNKLSFLGSFVALKAFIPSSVDENVFMNDPSAADSAWNRSKGFEDYNRGIFGASWTHNYNNKLKHITSIFTTFRNALEPRPFNILKENTIAIGLRSRILGKLKIKEHSVDWTFGGEFFNDSHGLKTFENLYEEFPVGTGSVEGDKLSSFRENRSYYNLFFQAESNPTEKMLISFGINFNQTRYTLDDKFITNENPDRSGSYKFVGMWSPKFGVSYLFTNNLSVYSNISHGFSPPTIEETLLPDGQINTDIKPETGWTFEIGTRGSLFNNRVLFNMALYQMSIKNLLVARRTAEDQFIGVNAGKTRHNGLEFSLNYNGYHTHDFSIDSYLSYALNNFIFKDFIDDNNNFSGNDLTGVPSEVVNLGLNLSTKLGLYANINYQHVGKIPMNDSNALYSDAYNLVNSKVGYKIGIAKNKLAINTFLGINNIFDVKYASQILINATGFGGKAPRYYYPGNPVNYHAGININYLF